MKVFVSVVALISIVLGWVSLVRAEQPASAPASQRARAAGVKAHGNAVQLNLTDQQKAQIKEIMTKAREDAKSAPSRNAKQAIFKAANENIKQNVLTDEQRTKLAEGRAAAAERRHKRAASQPATATSGPATDSK